MASSGDSSGSEKRGKYEIVVKAYSIPFQADEVVLKFIEEYHELARAALGEILKAERFTRAERKRLRDKLLENWPYAAHYVDSAINQMLGLVKSYRRKLRRGKNVRRPRLRKKFVYVKSTLFALKGSKLRITIIPRKYYIEIDLSKYTYISPFLKEINEGNLRLGGLFLFSDKIILNFVKTVKYFKPRDWMSVDINLTNVTALAGLNVYRFDTRELYHIHRVYELKRRKIQRISAWNKKLSERLLKKYSGREKNRAKDFLHKLSNKIVEIAKKKQMGIILEDLNGIKERIVNGSKELNRKLSKWNARELQRMIEYKAKWNGIPVIYVNPRNSSCTCPVCGGWLIPQEGRLMRCPKCNFIEDRDFIATINLRMWGARGSPERVGGSEGKSPDDGPMKTNPYGIVVLERQRLGIKSHRKLMNTPVGRTPLATSPFQKSM